MVNPATIRKCRLPSPPAIPFSGGGRLFFRRGVARACDGCARHDPCPNGASHNSPGCNSGNSPVKTDPRSEGTPPNLRVSDIAPAPPMRCFLDTPTTKEFGAMFPCRAVRPVLYSESGSALPVSCVDGACPQAKLASGRVSSPSNPATSLRKYKNHPPIPTPASKFSPWKRSTPRLIPFL